MVLSASASALAPSSLIDLWRRSSEVSALLVLSASASATAPSSPRSRRRGTSGRQSRSHDPSTACQDRHRGAAVAKAQRGEGSVGLERLGGHVSRDGIISVGRLAILRSLSNESRFEQNRLTAPLVTSRDWELMTTASSLPSTKCWQLWHSEGRRQPREVGRAEPRPPQSEAALLTCPPGGRGECCRGNICCGGNFVRVITASTSQVPWVTCQSVFHSRMLSALHCCKLL